MVVGSFADQQALQVQGDFIVTDATGANILVADVSVPSLTFDGVAIAIDFADDDALVFGTGNDISIAWDGTDLDVTQAAENSSIKWGVDGAGIDHVFYGDTASVSMTWDQSANSLLLNDSALLVFGTGSDVTVRWDATDLDILAGADDLVIKFGTGTNSFDIWVYGNVAGDYLLWDASASALSMVGAAKLGAHKITTVAAQAGSVSLATATSGQYHISTGAVTYTLPAVATAAGCIWHFAHAAAGDFVITAPADTLVAFNDAAATSFTAGTNGEEIGFACTVFSDGTLYYLMVNLQAEAVSTTVGA
jgi:hypothetical protein